MKEYTYNDLVAMQEEAKQRVMEMQRKSKYAVEDMNKSVSLNTENKEAWESAEKQTTFPVHTVPVAQQPKSIQYPTGLVKSSAEKNKNTSGKNIREQSSDKSSVGGIQQKNDLASKFFNVFGKLSREESEKMLILALCMLLTNEQADENLIMALLYLIA